MSLHYPLHELFLYFLFYSFIGWVMETCYCSIRERRFVARGFLYGPICPIYGSGVVLMILFFTPLKGDLALFYAVAVAVMTGWEYFVGWLLETTTHVKYWDYSEEKFNLKGRVCLWVALTWGALSYVVIFWLHPPVERLYQRIPLPLIYALCGVLGMMLAADAAHTIHQLALISKLVVSVTAAGEELRVQAALGKAELSDKLSEKREELDERTEAARARYREQLALLEKHSRRFRRHYSRMRTNSRYHVSHEDIKAAAELALEELKRHTQK